MIIPRKYRLKKYPSLEPKKKAINTGDILAVIFGLALFGFFTIEHGKWVMKSHARMDVRMSQAVERIENECWKSTRTASPYVREGGYFQEGSR